MDQFLTEFKSKDDVISQYSAPADALKGAKIYIAWYGYGSYCGDSLVVFSKGGKLYENHGSHCSCYGLEGQWSPEETSWEALDMQDISGECDGSREANELLHKLTKRMIAKKKKS